MAAPKSRRIEEDPDLLLVDRARRGEPEAAAALYRRHKTNAYNLAFRMLGNQWDANDVTQEAFIKAFGALDRFKGEARFSTWLYRIVVNSVHDYQRKRVPEPVEDESLARLSHSVAAREGLESAAEATDSLSSPLRAALLSLNEGFRLAIVLCDLLGYSYAEAAEILEVEEGTIKSRIFRARASLSRALQEQGYGPRPASGTPGDSERTRVKEPGDSERQETEPSQGASQVHLGSDEPRGIATDA